MPFSIDSNPTQSEISDAINYLLSNFGGNFSTNPVTGQITSPNGSLFAYLYKYIAVKYADSIDGSTNFSNSPTNRLYYGIRNTNDSAESTNPTDYVWTKVSGGFGTTKYLYYQTNGGRQIQFSISTTAPDSTWKVDSGSSIDLDVITGTNGVMAAFPTIYQWVLGITPPARPTTTSTYTWATGGFAAPSGWSTTIPSNTTPGYVLFSLTVPLIVSVNTTTSTIDWTDTANPIKAVSSNGAVGAPGSRSSFIYFYYNIAQASAPTSPTTGQVSYNFSTNVASISTSGWSTTFTPGSLGVVSGNNHYWAISVTFSETSYGGAQNTPVITGPFTWTNFDGLVTFTNLANGQNSSGTVASYIDGGTITTNTLVVDKIKNNTSGTFNTYGGFGLGTGTTLGIYQAAGIFDSSSSTLFGLLARNTGNFIAIGAGTTGTTSFASGVSAVGSANSSLSTWKNAGVIGVGDGGGMFQTNGASNLQTGTSADIRLAYYNGGTSYASYIYSGASYPFTAGHDALQLLSHDIPEVGDLMVDVALIAAPTINDAITQMTVSSRANQKGVIGVFTGVTGTDFVPASLSEYVEAPDGTKTSIQFKPEYANIYDTYRCIGVNAIGEGKINVCGQNGNIAIGDLICTSDMAGKGMKQFDDLYHSYTVAKSRQEVIFTSPDQVFQIACIYLAG